MKAIHNILKIDQQSYDDYKFTCFFKWCDYYTELGIPLQYLVTSKHLIEWYNTEWYGVVELAFIKDNEDYINAKIGDSQTYLQLLANYPENIEKYYPSAIFKFIKQQLKKTYTRDENLHKNRTRSQSRKF